MIIDLNQNINIILDLLMNIIKKDWFIIINLWIWHKQETSYYFKENIYHVKCKGQLQDLIMVNIFNKF